MNFITKSSVLAWFVACSPTTTSPSPPSPLSTVVAEESCAVRIDTPNLPEPTQPETPDVAVSEVVVGVSLDTSTLTTRLANEIPSRVAHGHNVDAGVAGKLTYQIDRTPFSVTLRDRSLFISTVLRGRANLCKPLGPLGCVDYARCSPEADAIASVPLSLGASYRPGPAAVTIRTTRPCQIGGIDATPRIQQEANVQAQRIEGRINALLPSFLKDAQALWTVMGVHVPLGIDSRLRVIPTEVLEGVPRKDGSVVTIPLGVRATIRIEPRQGQRDEVGPLPSPSFEPDRSPSLRLDIPIEIHLDTIDADLSRSVRSLAGEATPILSLRSQPDGDTLRLIVSIMGRSCGLIAFRAHPHFDETTRRIHLGRVEPFPGEVERLRMLDPDLDLEHLASILESHGRMTLPVDPFAIPRGLEQAMDLITPVEGTEVRLNFQEVTVTRVVVMPRGLAALVHVRGDAQVVIE